jgi:hypothetical protein
VGSEASPPTGGGRSNFRIEDPRDLTPIVNPSFLGEFGGIQLFGSWSRIESQIFFAARRMRGLGAW